MKKWRAFKKIIKYFGLAGVPVAIKQLFSDEESLIAIRSPYVDHPIHFRINTTDASIYWQIFINREYDIPMSIRPKLIVDAGANVGYSAIYFAKRFPDAKIFALEPEKSNFEVLKLNTASYPNIFAVDKALWHETGKLSFFAPPASRAGAQKDGFHIALDHHDQDRTFDVECLTIAEILASTGQERIDLLKIDVEGAEKSIFANASGWIDKVDLIISEMHDRIVPGCSRAFYAATNDFAFELHKGENIIVSRTPLQN